MDYLSPALFERLLKVLTILPSQGFFTDLLTAENIREVTDHPEHFVPKVILKLKSLGSGAGQRTLSDLFKWVGASVKGTSGNGVGADLPCDEMDPPRDVTKDFPPIAPTVGKRERMGGFGTDLMAQPQKKKKAPSPVKLSNNLVEPFVDKATDQTESQVSRVADQFERPVDGANATKCKVVLDFAHQGPRRWLNSQSLFPCHSRVDEDDVYHWSGIRRSGCPGNVGPLGA